MKYDVVWALGGWSDEIDAAREGGVCLGSFRDLEDAVESVACATQDAVLMHWPKGEAVITNEHGDRLNMLTGKPIRRQQTMPKADGWVKATADDWVNLPRTLAVERVLRDRMGTYGTVTVRQVARIYLGAEGPDGTPKIVDAEGEDAIRVFQACELLCAGGAVDASEVYAHEPEQPTLDELRRGGLGDPAAS